MFLHNISYKNHAKALNYLKRQLLMNKTRQNVCHYDRRNIHYTLNRILFELLDNLYPLYTCVYAKKAVSSHLEIILYRFGKDKRYCECP